MIGRSHHIIIVIANVYNRRLLLNSFTLFGWYYATQKIIWSICEGICTMTMATITITVTAYVIDNVGIYVIYVVRYAVSGIRFKLSRAEFNRFTSILVLVLVNVAVTADII